MNTKYSIIIVGVLLIGIGFLIIFSTVTINSEIIVIEEFAEAYEAR